MVNYIVRIRLELEYEVEADTAEEAKQIAAEEECWLPEGIEDVNLVQVDFEVYNTNHDREYP